MNYCEAHDNNTLWDKLCISAKNDSEGVRIKMDKLAAAIVILSQGMPFIQLGQDFLRSKPRILKEGEEPNDVNIYSHDSYNAPDYTNSIKWNRKLEYKEVFEYYKALIRLRKGSPLFRMYTKEDVNAHLHFMHNDDWNCVSWKLEKDGECYVIALNPYYENRGFGLPEGSFYLRLDESGKMNKKPVSGSFVCPPLSAVVYKRIKNI